MSEATSARFVQCEMRDHVATTDHSWCVTSISTICICQTYIYVRMFFSFFCKMHSVCCLFANSIFLLPKFSFHRRLTNVATIYTGYHAGLLNIYPLLRWSYATLHQFNTGDSGSTPSSEHMQNLFCSHRHYVLWGCLWHQAIQLTLNHFFRMWDGAVWKDGSLRLE